MKIMSEIIFEEKTEEKGYRVSVLGVKLDNGIVVIVTDTTYKMGTLVLATPSTLPEVGKKAISSLLTAFDVKGEVVARAIAERLAIELSTAVLTIVNLKEKSMEKYRIVVKCIDKLIKRLKGL